ncbi:nucleoside kinase [Clostridium sp. ATCC 25772]|uniref:nucleoside kinase n=1 Tax=Clostridium sp. ATCC 25772 TaxID=1676991 RepID=UPI000785803B|nr:nucleoside kinase [Clostridium sp. ATCC 25772]
MKKIKLKILDSYIEEFNEGITGQEIVRQYNLDLETPIVLCSVNNEKLELSSEIMTSGDFNIIGIEDKMGMMTYIRTLQFVLIKATLDIFKDSKITIEHSLSKGIFGEIHKKTELNIDDIYLIKNRMKELIERDIPIKKISVGKEKALNIFKTYNMDDKIKLLKSINQETVKLYELDGRYDYFYGPMAFSTGALKKFDLMYYDPGFILRFPIDEKTFEIPYFKNYRQLSNMFYETEKWAKLVGVGNCGTLNEVIQKGDIVNLIRICEAYQEKKIGKIADEICKNKRTNIVLIAGPSSSGKTTFAKRLGIQLEVNGVKPVPISLDDYFVNREQTPLDEYGEYDFESIYALDLSLFNDHIKMLLNGCEIEIQNFNFKTGKREWIGNKMKLPEDGVLIVEGIHGLNELLTTSIEKERKFKIYISPLTQLNLDDHNRIATTDMRIIRRIVRDYLSRGCDAERTLKMWPSIRRGEEKNIFVFQEDADIMFNSSLMYELAVLKKYALEQLLQIDSNSSVYYEAKRLISFLNFFKDIDEKLVPNNSIIREFIGGSCFYQY